MAATYYIPKRDEEFERRQPDAFRIAFYVVDPPNQTIMFFEDRGQQPVPESMTVEGGELYDRVSESALL